MIYDFRESLKKPSGGGGGGVLKKLGGGGGGGEYYKTFEEGVSVTIRLPESDTETSTYCLKPFY